LVPGPVATHPPAKSFDRVKTTVVMSGRLQRRGGLACGSAENTRFNWSLITRFLDRCARKWKWRYQGMRKQRKGEQMPIRNSSKRPLLGAALLGSSLSSYVDVPISMTIFSQQALSDRNIVTATDLAAATPSAAVYFADAVLPRGGSVSDSAFESRRGYLSWKSKVTSAQADRSPT
jgi:hypothetical protein